MNFNESKRETVDENWVGVRNCKSWCALKIWCTCVGVFGKSNINQVLWSTVYKYKIFKSIWLYKKNTQLLGKKTDNSICFKNKYVTIINSNIHTLQNMGLLIIYIEI